MSVVLAIDPSVADCGWAVLLAAGLDDRRGHRVRDSGTWHPSRASGQPDRIEQLAGFVFDLVRRGGVTDAAVEIPDGGERYFRGRDGRPQRMGGRNVRTYAQAVGACRAAASVAGARVWPIGTTTWKGTGNKSVALLIARHSLGREPRDTNEADAIGLGLWWLSNRYLLEYGAHAADVASGVRYASAVSRAWRR